MSRLTLPALSYGLEVEAMWGAHGRVLATVSGAMYLESVTGKIVGIVGPGAEDGPLSLRIVELDGLRCVEQGTAFCWSGDALEIGEAVRITFQEARRWQPELPTRVASRRERAEAAKALAARVHGEHARLVAGVAVLALDDKVGAEYEVSDPTTRLLLAHLERVRDSFRAGSEADTTAALATLLGVGPGLTPSGDDVAAGIVAAFVWRARVGDMYMQVASSLGALVSAAAPLRTNRISARLLAHACEGTLYAAAMKLGTALMEGRPGDVALATARLLSIGATTGADLAAGLMFGVLA